MTEIVCGRGILTADGFVLKSEIIRNFANSGALIYKNETLMLAAAPESERTFAAGDIIEVRFKVGIGETYHFEIENSEPVADKSVADSMIEGLREAIDIAHGVADPLDYRVHPVPLKPDPASCDHDMHCTWYGVVVQYECSRGCGHMETFSHMTGDQL